MLNLIPLPYKLLAIAAALVAAFSFGWFKSAQHEHTKQVASALVASEQARQTEQSNAINLIRRVDNYTATQAQIEAESRVSRSAVVSVQHSLAAIAASPAASACPADPRLTAISGLLAEGAGLVAEGADYVEELRAQRDALK